MSPTVHTDPTPSQPWPADKLLTLRQVLEQLGVCRATLYKIVKRGDLTIVKLGGASRVRATDLQQYVEQLPKLHAEEAK